MAFSTQLESQMHELLSGVYGDETAQRLSRKILARIEASPLKQVKRREWNARDIMLIAYGDSIASADESPLNTLHHFLRTRLSNSISIVHILPFYPYTSDDGFAVSDYLSVNPDLGSWSDVEALSNDFEMMFDLTINHASSEHPFFQEFLRNEAPGNAYFLTAPQDTDVTQVTRPRTSDLLQAFPTKNGIEYVWCTFSRDQVDWDFKNPDVLMEFVEIVATYMERGATWLRMDAIAYLWKEIGTSCIHLSQTHQIVKLLRLLATAMNPQATILTETNVPNDENLSYFGQGDEAHVVYNFSLPPLVLHALLTGQGKWLSQWCATLPELPAGCTYLNFTASHDGIGVRPAEGIIPDDELTRLFETMSSFGGLLTYRTHSDGTKSPYEVNISLYDALKGTVEGEDNYQQARFVCSQAIMMALAGVPAIYYNSLLATPNHNEGVAETNHNRTINRRKWQLSEVNERLDTPDHSAHQVFEKLKTLISIRRSFHAFDPGAQQEALSIDPRIFALKRTNLIASSKMLCLFNLSGETIHLTHEQLGLENHQQWTDIVSDSTLEFGATGLTLIPYQVVWIPNN